MSKLDVAHSLVEQSFNSIIRYYSDDASAREKKQAITEKCAELIDPQRSGNTVERMHQELTRSLNSDREFMRHIDQQRGLFGSKVTNTRIRLEALKQSLVALSAYHGAIDDNIFSSIWETFEACILKTESKDKKLSLTQMRASILSQPDTPTAIATLNDAMNTNHPFYRAIAEKTGIGWFSNSPSNTQQQLSALLEWLRNPQAVVQNVENPNLANWMSRHEDHILLGDLVVPGSHDAGVYNDPTDFANRPHARNMSDLTAGICQSLSIYNQAKAGVRYFDIRFEEYKEGSGLYRATHDWNGFGVWGASSTKILRDIISFLREYPTECIYLKITHTMDPYLIRHVMDFLGQAVYSKRAHHGRSLTQVMLGEVRGKVIVLIEDDIVSDKNAVREITAERREGFHRFKNVKGDESTFGRVKRPQAEQELVIWGGNTSSLVDRTFKGWDANLTNLIHGQIKKAILQYDNRETLVNCFFQMSWTIMGGNVLENAQRAHDLLPALIDMLLGNKQAALAVSPLFNGIQGDAIFENRDRRNSYPNFLHMDNANPTTSRQILRLNDELIPAIPMEGVLPVYGGYFD